MRKTRFVRTETLVPGLGGMRPKEFVQRINPANSQYIDLRKFSRLPPERAITHPRVVRKDG